MFLSFQDRNTGSRERFPFPAAITKNTTKKELEEEAEQEERQEIYDPDPFISVDIDGEIFRVRKSELNKIAYEEAEEIKNWLTHQKHILSEEKYLELLCRTEQWTREAD